MNRGLLYTFIIVIIISAVSPARAQELPQELPYTGTFQDKISLQIIPVVPQPGQAINAEVKSLNIDISRLPIVWYINGKVIQQGIGLTKIQTKAAGAGEPFTIRVVVTSDEKKFEQSMTLTTGSVDLLWQAESYTPPFYKGKALLPY